MKEPENNGEDGDFATRGIHSGENTCSRTGALKAPVYYASSFEFEGVEDGAQKCEDFHAGYCYTRQSNPSQTVFEGKIAELEEAEAALAFATGTGAVSGLLLHHLTPGDHVIADKTTYSSTHYVLENLLGKFGVNTSFIDTGDLEKVEEAIREETELIYIESPANPTIKIIDIEGIADLGRKHSILTAIDSTFATPYLQSPLNLGMDVVIHSATKYIGGHSDAMGGVLAGSQKMMDNIRHDTLKNIGAVISPRNAYIFSRGLETLEVRMKKHCRSARKIAGFFKEHEKIKNVNYPGLESHPGHENARKQMTDYGGMISFEVKGGLEAGKKVMENVELCTLAVDLGHVKTLIEHPASMTHWYVDREQRLESGITDGLVRISIGLEDAENIREDLEQALASL
ncbi:trans-sulfuration enzyme family protein [Halarsenatibacter silvermanii]|uniref:homocysteine desulfhydrase n=1 Tax=Halarsenatibacter silvermanii TaxID=321763 RepID=A0A1G9N1V2_9FIRM|nr:aminotransferase class I/II-fold pyridoxal phosphate-dependent enzyme [Halarsenatibacter silvermanii]SDL80241.1 methionine-gamma-lyase [Halarsenatibacter silvermanii]